MIVDATLVMCLSTIHRDISQDNVRESSPFVTCRYVHNDDSSRERATRGVVEFTEAGILYFTQPCAREEWWRFDYNLLAIELEDTENQEPWMYRHLVIVE